MLLWEGAEHPCWADRGEEMFGMVLVPRLGS